MPRLRYLVLVASPRRPLRGGRSSSPGRGRLYRELSPPFPRSTLLVVTDSDGVPSSEQQRALGKLVFRSSQLEAAFLELIVTFMDEIADVHATVGRASFWELVDVSERFARSKTPTLVEDFKSVAAVARAAYTTRNRIVHGWWSTDATYQFRFERRELDFERWPVAFEDIATATAALTAATAEVKRFTGEARTLVRARTAARTQQQGVQ